MHNFILLILLVFFLSDATYGQVKARTKSGSFGVPDAPAKLSADVVFTEPSGDKVLDANEKGIIAVTVTNSGGALAKDVRVTLASSTLVEGLTFAPSLAVGDIAPGQSATAKFDIAGASNIRSQAVPITVEASDAQGIKTERTVLQLALKESPAVLLTASLQFSEPSNNGQLDAGERGIIKLTVTNSGEKIAKNVTATLKTGVPVQGLRFTSTALLKDIPPRSFAVATFDLTADEAIKTQTITFVAVVSEASGMKMQPQSIIVSTKEKTIAKDNTPPRIDLVEPVIAATRGLDVISEASTTALQTQKSSVTIKGIAKDESGVALVLVNGMEAPLSLSQQGTEFASDVLLVLGLNEVEIKAVDKFRNESSLKLTITRQPVVVEEKKIDRKNLYKGQRWAVVVGISDYKSPDIPDLRYADRDAEGFHDLLMKRLEEGGLDVPKSNIRFLLNESATSKNVREALTDFLKNAIEDDMVFIYFAGHGAPDPDRPRVLYLLTYDSDLAALASSSIRMQEVQDALRDYCAANSVLVFADACHSRGVTGLLATRSLAPADLVNEYLAELARARSSTLTFSASDVNQLSQEDKRWGGGHGVFTYYLLEGLKGKADLNADRMVRLGELTQYVSDNVRRDTKAQQSPIPSGSPDINLPLTIVVEKK